MPVHKQILRSRPSAWETGSGSSQVTISEESLEGSLPLEQQDEKYPVGTAVTKYFNGHGWSQGKIVAAFKGEYKVLFDLSGSTIKEGNVSAAEMARLTKTAQVREGTRLEIFWPHEQRYYCATIRKERTRKRENYLVCYDGDIADREWIDLHRHKFRIFTDQKLPASHPEEVVVYDNDETDSHDEPTPRRMDRKPMAIARRAASPPSVLRSREPECATLATAVAPVSDGVAMQSAASAIVLDSNQNSPGGSLGCGAVTSSLTGNGKEPARIVSMETGTGSGDEQGTGLKLCTPQKEKQSTKLSHDDFESDPGAANAMPSIVVDYQADASCISGDRKSAAKVSGGTTDTCKATNTSKKDADNEAVKADVDSSLAVARAKNESADTDDEEGVDIDPVSDPSTRSVVMSLIAIGSRVSVYWEDDEEYYPGTITDIRVRGAPFYLEYDDGEEEWIDLRRFKFRLLSSTTSRQHSETLTARERKRPVRAKEEEADVNRTISFETEENEQAEASQKPANADVSDSEFDDDCVENADDEPILKWSSGKDEKSNDISAITVGKRVAVWWDGDKKYYCGTVKRERVNSKPFYVVYDDQAAEWIDFRQHRYQVLPNEPPQKRKRGRPKAGQKLRPEDATKIRLGSRVAVWWSNIKQFFEGKVTKERSSEKPFYIEYDGAHTGHWIDFSKYTFRLLDEKVDSDCDEREEPPKKKAKVSKPDHQKQSAARPEHQKFASKPGSATSDLGLGITVGTRVSVYWEGESKYYEGVVRKERKTGRRRHYLEYNDGEAAHWIDFNDHWVRVLPASDKPLARTMRRRSGAAAVGEQKPKTKHKEITDVRLKSTVEIWWEGDNRYYRGTVTRKGKKEGRFLVEYEDGENEWVNFHRQKYRLLSIEAEEAEQGEVEEVDLQDTDDDTCLENHYEYNDFVYGDVDNVKIGTRLGVWWSAEQKYFPCKVKKIDASRKPYFLVYDDGDEEWTDLKRRYFRFLD